jgi:hypothetical protein
MIWAEDHINLKITIISMRLLIIWSPKWSFLTKFFLSPRFLKKLTHSDIDYKEEKGKQEIPF